MPTVMRQDGYRFHFYSNEGREPPHIHVRHVENECKFWLEPVELAYNHGMNSGEITHLRQFVEDHRLELLREWNEHHR